MAPLAEKYRQVGACPRISTDLSATDFMTFSCLVVVEYMAVSNEIQGIFPADHKGRAIDGFEVFEAVARERCDETRRDQVG